MSNRLEKVIPRTLYVRRDLVNASELVAWAKDQGFKTTVPADEMHVTIMYSKTPVDWIKMGANGGYPYPSSQDNSQVKPGYLYVAPGGPRVVEPLGNEGAIVLLFDCPELKYRNEAMRDKGATWDYPTYQAHVTFTYNGENVDLSKVEPYQGQLIFGPEIFEEIQPNWQDNLVEKSGTTAQSIHDRAVELGATCECFYKGEKVVADIIKVDTNLGLVFGWAVICKKDGEDYYDLNRDVGGERVPEHIPEGSMLEAATDFMENSRLAKEMHVGDGKGSVVFAFPLTTDIAKAMGISTRTTGLMIAMKPSTPELLEKYRSGAYKGFSIGGKRLSVEETPIIKSIEEDDVDIDDIVKVLGEDADAKDFIHDFVHSDNSRFKGDSKKKRIQRALAAYYARNK